jgi:hypothetical protein
VNGRLSDPTACPLRADSRLWGWPPCANCGHMATAIK